MDRNEIETAVVISIALVPVIGLLLVRKKLGVLNAAARLVRSVHLRRSSSSDGDRLDDGAKGRSNWMVRGLVHAPFWGCLRGGGKNYDLPSRTSAALYPRRLALVFIYRGTGERTTDLIPAHV